MHFHLRDIRIRFIRVLTQGRQERIQSGSGWWWRGTPAVTQSRKSSSSLKKELPFVFMYKYVCHALDISKQWQANEQFKQTSMESIFGAVVRCHFVICMISSDVRHPCSAHVIVAGDLQIKGVGSPCCMLSVSKKVHCAALFLSEMGVCIWLIFFQHSHRRSRNKPCLI